MESLHHSEKVDISLTFHFSKNCWEKLSICLCSVMWSCSVVSDSATPWLCSPPGSSVHGISQARLLEWVAISFSRGSSQPRDWTQVSLIAGGFFTSWATRKAYSCSDIIIFLCFTLASNGEYIEERRDEKTKSSVKDIFQLKNDINVGMDDVSAGGVT